MSDPLAVKTPQGGQTLALLEGVLAKAGGASVSFPPGTAPQTRVIELLTAIRDSLGATTLAPGVFGGGVTGITFCFRPRGEPADAESMSGYIVHGPHVNSFTINATHAYAPALQGNIYEIQLDRA